MCRKACLFLSFWCGVEGWCTANNVLASSIREFKINIYSHAKFRVCVCVHGIVLPLPKSRPLFQPGLRSVPAHCLMHCCRHHHHQWLWGAACTYPAPPCLRIILILYSGIIRGNRSIHAHRHMFWDTMLQSLAPDNVSRSQSNSGKQQPAEEQNLVLF